MNICTIDGIAHYARWKIGDEYAYTEKERDRLIKKNKDVKVEELPEPKGFSVTKGIKYNSKTDADAHIKDGIEPESMVIPNLKKRLDEAEAKEQILEKEINTLKQELSELRQEKS